MESPRLGAPSWLSQQQHPPKHTLSYQPPPLTHTSLYASVHTHTRSLRGFERAPTHRNTRSSETSGIKPRRRMFVTRQAGGAQQLKHRHAPPRPPQLWRSRSAAFTTDFLSTPNTRGHAGSSNDDRRSTSQRLRAATTILTSCQLRSFPWQQVPAMCQKAEQQQTQISGVFWLFC